MIGTIRWEREVVRHCFNNCLRELTETTKKIKVFNYLTEIRTQHKSGALPLKLSCSIMYHLNITI